MDIGTATVVSSIIGSVFGLIGLAVKEFRAMKKENKKDHGAVMQKLGEMQYELDEVHSGIYRVAERLDDHIDWHLKK